MKRIAFFVLLCLVFGGELFSSYKLKLVKTIGDDRDDYIFYRISSAVLSDKKDIYIADRRCNFVAKYNWNGKFIKRIGQLGNEDGTGEFNSPTSLNIVDSKLYILDEMNYRIAWTDLNLSGLKYQPIGDKKTKSQRNFSSFTVLKHGQCIANSSVSWEGNGRMVNFDWEKNEVKSFFNHYPINCVKNLKYMDFLPVFCYDAVKGNILVTFQYPGNPIKFYLYSREGKELKGFDYPFEKHYRLPDHFYEKEKLPPDEYYFFAVNTILMYERKFLVFLTKFYEKGELSVSERVKQFCLVFDESGTFLEKFPVAKGLGVFFISKEGYVLAKNFDVEDEKLYIYKLVRSK